MNIPTSSNAIVSENKAVTVENPKAQHVWDFVADKLAHSINLHSKALTAKVRHSEENNGEIAVVTLLKSTGIGDANTPICEFIFMSNECDVSKNQNDYVRYNYMTHNEIIHKKQLHDNINDPTKPIVPYLKWNINNQWVSISKELDMLAASVLFDYDFVLFLLGYAGGMKVPVVDIASIVNVLDALVIQSINYSRHISMAPQPMLSNLNYGYNTEYK